VLINSASRLFHKYQQAEWRIQRQWIGLILLGLVVVVLVAAAYLSVTARTALAGRQVQDLKQEITSNEFVNADLKVELAQLTSKETMAPKAMEMGYHEISPEEITYVMVAGYSPRPDFKITPAAGAEPEVLMAPEYSESLIDWFIRQIRPYVGVQP